MKIKSDFVTNSSSTAYVVCIPLDYVPTDEEIKEVYSFHRLYGAEDLTDEQLFKELKFGLFDLLKEGDNLWNYGEDGTHHMMFGMVADICTAREFVISVFEISNEGNNRIQGVTEEELTKWFMNTQLNKLTLKVDND